MSHYSQTNILNKIFIFNRIIKERGADFGLLVGSDVYALVSLRELTRRGYQVNEYGIAILNRANAKDSSLPNIKATVERMALLGYVIVSKTGRYKISLAGLACLDELEVILKRSVFKKKRSDSNSLTKPPGRKKGVVYAADINKRK